MRVILDLHATKNSRPAEWHLQSDRITLTLGLPYLSCKRNDALEDEWMNEWMNEAYGGGEVSLITLFPSKGDGAYLTDGPHQRI